MHPCNRCVRGDDASVVRGSTLGGVGAAGGARGAKRRRSSRRRATRVPGPSPFIFSERQVPVHADPTLIYIYIIEYFYLFIVLSYRS
jgi:hypothetical protein